MTALADVRAARDRARTGLRPASPLTAIPVLVLLLGTLAAAAPWLAQVEHPAQRTLLVLDLLLLAASLAIGVTRGFRPMIALSAAFVLAWIALPSLYQLAHGVAAWRDDAVLTERGPVTAALVLIALAQGCLLLGYAAGTFLLRDRAPRAARAVPDRSLLVAGVLIALALIALPAVAQVLGGVQTLFASRSGITDAAADAGIDLEQSGGVGIALLRVVPMSLSVAGTLLAMQYLLRFRRSGRSRGAGWWVALAGAALVVVYANPLANSRFTALAALGSLALLLCRPRRPAAAMAVVGTFIVFMLFAYPLANVFRGDGASQLDDVPSGGGPFAYLGSRDYDGFQQIVNAFLFVGQQGHSGGRYLLSAVLVFVPRSVWPDKATPASLDVAGARGYSFTDLSLPTNAELYIDFGWIGVVAVFLLLGIVYARLDRMWLTGNAFGALIAFAAVAQIGIIRGPLGSIVPVVDLTLLLVVVEAALHARAGHPPARSPIGRT